MSALVTKRNSIELNVALAPKSGLGADIAGGVSPLPDIALCPGLHRHGTVARPGAHGNRRQVGLADVRDKVRCAEYLTAPDDQERWRLCFFSNTDADVSRLDIGVISQFLWAAVENDASLIQDTNVVGDFEGDRQLLHDDQDA